MAKVFFSRNVKFNGQWYAGEVDIPDELYAEAIKVGAFKIEGGEPEQESRGKSKQTKKEEAKVQKSDTKQAEEEKQKVEEEVELVDGELAEEVEVNIDKLKKAELQQLAEHRGIEYDKNATMADLKELLR